MRVVPLLSNHAVSGRRSCGPCPFGRLLAILIALVGFADRAAEAGRLAARGAAATVTYSSNDGIIAETRIVLRKSQIMTFDDPYDSALIADTEIADVVPLSNRSLYVLGRKLGATRLVLTGADKSVQKIVEITVTHDLDALRDQLAANVDISNIRVSTVNDTILLAGTARDAVESQRAVMIAERYAPGAVSNALGIDSVQQVLLEVRFLEVSRSASRELGISERVRSGRIAADLGAQAALTAAGVLIPPNMLSGAQPFGSVLARLFDNGVDVDALIRALERNQLARRLAEPNLIATSGDTASFLAGGEFPIPVSAEDQKVFIEYKPFGVALSFTPTVLSGGQINLKIVPEVSEVDPSTSVAVNGIQVPGLIVRRANTTVELKDGQSLAIAGLLQSQSFREHSQLPWIGKVPYLGALFRSSAFQNRETDLVIIVTPRLVKPKLPGEVLRSPLDSHAPGNDVDTFLMGRDEIAKGGADERGRRRATKPVGHIIRLHEVAYAQAK